MSERPDELEPLPEDEQFTEEPEDEPGYDDPLPEEEEEQPDQE